MNKKIIDTNTVFGLWPRTGADCSLERLIAVLEKNNVERAFTLSARGIFYDFIEGNDETYSTCRKQSRLIPVATITPQRYYGCHEEIIKRWEQGFKAFKFFPEIQEWGMDFLPFRNLFDTLAKTKAIIILPSSLGISNISNLTLGLNNPVIISELRYSYIAECLEVLHKNKNIYLEAQRLANHGIFASEGLIDRLVIGSFSPVRYMASSITQIEYEVDLSNEEKDMVFYKNIEKVLQEVDR